MNEPVIEAGAVDINPTQEQQLNAPPPAPEVNQEQAPQAQVGIPEWRAAEMAAARRLAEQKAAESELRMRELELRNQQYEQVLNRLAAERQQVRQEVSPYTNLTPEQQQAMKILGPVIAAAVKQHAPPPDPRLGTMLDSYEAQSFWMQHSSDPQELKQETEFVYAQNKAAMPNLTREAARYYAFGLLEERKLQDNVARAQASRTQMQQVNRNATFETGSTGRAPVAGDKWDPKGMTGDQMLAFLLARGERP